MMSLFKFIIRKSTVSEFKRKYINQNLSIVLNVAIIASILVTLVASSGFWLVPEIKYITGSAILVLFLLKYLNKKGHNSLAGISTSFVMFLVANFSMFFGRGFRDESMLIFPGIIVLSSMILNRFYFSLFTSITIINVIIIGVLNFREFLFMNLADILILEKSSQPLQY